MSVACRDQVLDGYRELLSPKSECRSNVENVAIEWDLPDQVEPLSRAPADHSTAMHIQSLGRFGQSIATNAD